jgi:hypothetical protein
MCSELISTPSLEASHVAQSTEPPLSEKIGNQSSRLAFINTDCNLPEAYQTTTR